MQIMMYIRHRLGGGSVFLRPLFSLYYRCEEFVVEMQIIISWPKVDISDYNLIITLQDQIHIHILKVTYFVKDFTKTVVFSQYSPSPQSRPLLSLAPPFEFLCTPLVTYFVRPYVRSLRVGHRDSCFNL